MQKLRTSLLFIFLFCALFVANLLRAQDCGAIIRHGLRNIEISNTEDVRIAALYFSHCQKNFSSMTDSQLVNVEVEIFGAGKGTGGFTSDRRKQDLQEWCTQNRSTSFSHQREAQNVQTFYQGAVSAWSRCNELVARGLHLIPDISNDQKTVLIKVFFTGGGSGPRLHGFESDAFNCDARIPNGNTLAAFNAANLPTITTQSINVLCSRKAATTRQFNDQNFSVLPGGTISVMTAQDNLQLSFPEIWDPPLPTQIVTSLKNENEARKREIEDLKVGLEASLPIM